LVALLSARGWRCYVFCGPQLEFADGRRLHELINDERFHQSVGLIPSARTGVDTVSSLLDFTQMGTPVRVFDAPGASDVEEAYLYRLYFDRAVEEFQPDLVLAYGGRRLIRDMEVSARRRRVHLVFWLQHGLDYSPDDFQDMAGVLVPSYFAMDYFGQKLGLKFTMMPPPLDWPARVCGEAEGKHVTFVNPLPETGVFVFARIAEELRRRRPDIPLLVVEGRGQLSWLRQAGPDPDKPGNVSTKAGIVEPREVYQASRMVLMPSLRDEVFDRTAVEALANGIPVLASRRGGLPEVLDHAGFLCDIPPQYTAESRVMPAADEVTPWVETIIRLWDDAAFYEQERRRSLAAVEIWKPERLAPRYDYFLSARCRAR
jgi:glycosyltransferase involved in cell wall biosynthesis